MVTTLLLVLSAAPVKLAVPGVRSVGVDPQLASVWVERLVVLAKQPGLDIVTATDIEQVLGLERQRQLLGCAESSCIAELAGALGADALLSGTVARSGASLTLVLRVLRAKDGQELVSASVRVSTEDQLQDWLETNAAAFGARVVRRSRGEPDEWRPPGWARWATLGAGLLLAGAGGGLYGAAHLDAEALRTANASTTLDVTMLRSRGQAFEVAGLALLSVGGAALISSVVFFIAHRSGADIALVPTRDGAALVWGGTFP